VFFDTRRTSSFFPPKRSVTQEKKWLAVAAVDEDTALEALSLIDVTYEVLPAVYTIDDAIAPGAPQLHEVYPNNINIHVFIDVGDVEKGFADSFLVREDTFTAPEDAYFRGNLTQLQHSSTVQGILRYGCRMRDPHLKASPSRMCSRSLSHKVRVRRLP
jgi:CO/xanthine dehydrogenase Mo-binding subunit